MLSRNLAEPSPDQDHRESMLPSQRRACFRGASVQHDAIAGFRESMAHGFPLSEVKAEGRNLLAVSAGRLNRLPLGSADGFAE
jgi:hypothetical protein